MGIFKVKNITSIPEIKVGDTVSESDYSLYTTDDKFVQFEYIDDEKAVLPYEVSKGIFFIDKTAEGMCLKPSSFSQDSILEEYVHTADITKKINCFFSKLDVYKKFGIEVPKRAILLYGPPGTGKSFIISKISEEYKSDAVVVLWHTDRFDPTDVKNFIKRFKYKDASKLILVVEDIGGAEVERDGRMPSDSSLLSLLDNVEKTFTVPTLILATTNYPQNLLENLTNRPQRFDDKIEVPRPTPEFREKFLRFFSQGEVDDSICELIKDKKYDDFSIAHIKEIVIRSAIYDISMQESLNQVAEDVKIVKKHFEKMKQSIGLGGVYD